jgi:hypothetical protein
LRAGETPRMRVLFLVYLLGAIAGLVYFTVIGLTQR